MWIRADMGPREIGVLFLYLGESRQEGVFLLADLAGSKNRGKSVENLPGWNDPEAVFTKLVLLSKNIRVSENSPST